MKLITPPFTPDQQLWISEILECYKRNEKADEAAILLKCHGRLSSKNMPLRNLDHRLLNNGMLNIYGIYCFSPENDFIKQIDLILKHIKKNLCEKRKVPRTFTAKELSQALGISEHQVMVCFRLIKDVGNFIDGSTIPYIGIGCPAIVIQYVSTAHNCLQYESIDSLLKFFPKAAEVPQVPQDESTAQRAGYLVKGSTPSNRLFIHKQILESDFKLLLSEKRRGPKISDIPRISDSSTRKPEELEQCPEGYELRIEWVLPEISEKTLYRVLNLPISNALSLIDHLRRNQSG